MIINGAEYFSPIIPIGNLQINGTDYSENNNYYIKRDDFIPFSFGGNKARMAMRYFDDAAEKKAGSIITYGSTSSNMCRIIANLSCSRGLPCYIVTPDEFSEETNNSLLCESVLNANIIRTDVVHSYSVIKNLKEDLEQKGLNPYFIESGGHGLIGTAACVECYDEITAFETCNGIYFDRIYLAAGTGTTLSGLVAGMVVSGEKHIIYGISVAQENPRGRNIAIKSTNEYLKSIGYSGDYSAVNDCLNFIDDYVGEGYGKSDSDTVSLVKQVFQCSGIPLDCVYTGKGFQGMLKHVESQGIHGNNILFVHTGGTPLFFNSVL